MPSSAIHRPLAHAPRARHRARAAAALALALAFACRAGAAGPLIAPADDAVAIRLIAFNDFHGHLEPGNNNLVLADPQAPGKTRRVSTGGAAYLAGLVQRLRAEARHSVVFSSGDLVGAAPLASTLFRHETTVTAMNALGLDFGIVGNHEFDAGQDELRRLAQGGCAPNPPDRPQRSCTDGRYPGMRFPLLAANVEDAQGHPLFAPTWVATIDGVKLGFIGVVTRTTPGIVAPSGVRGLSFRDEAGTLNRYAAQLRSQGVNAIVAVVHEGAAIDGDWNDTTCPGLNGRLVEIVNQLAPSIDLVFSGHTHQGYHCVLATPHQRDLHVLQATSYGRGVSLVDLVIDRQTGRIDRSRVQGRNLPVVNTAESDGATPAVAPDPAVAAIVQRAVEQAAPLADQVVGSITERIERAGREDPESPAGRLVADAHLAATQASAQGGAQLAFTNTGGIRTALACAGKPPCAVSYDQVATMQPFGNSLVVMTLTGRQLKALLEDQQTPRRSAPHFLQVSRGLHYTWVRGAAYGERVRELSLDGRRIAPDERLRVAVNSYLAEGGDGFARLRDGTDRTGGPLDAEALADYLRAHPRYAPDRAARITLID